MPEAVIAMPIYSNVNPAWDAICDYMAHSPDWPALDNDTKTAVADMLKGSSVSFAVAHFAEWAFARTADLPPSFLSLGAGCSHVCVMNPGGIDNVEGDRGVGMRDALRRDAGEPAPAGVTWPDETDDPAPREAFVKPDPNAAEPDLPEPPAGPLIDIE